MLQFLNEKNDIVQEVGACNCIKLSDGTLIGFNTDVIGFKQSLQKFLEPHHKQALVFGTGGSSKAVQYSLKTLGITYQKVSRKSKVLLLVMKN